MTAFGADGLGPIALTMGDPAGIGIEITLKAWKERTERTIPPFFLIADPEAVADRAKLLGIEVAIEPIAKARDALSVFGRHLPVLPLKLSTKSKPGEPDPANAPDVVQSIEDAVALVVRGEASAIVTNPLAKVTLTSAGFPFPGHTEFLQALAEQHRPGPRYRAIMMLVSDDLRTVPLTIHIPLAKVPGSITRGLIIETVRATWQALSRDFGIDNPRIAVAGLNPHAGESGTIGSEETETIAPAVAGLRAEGIAVTGPHPADTLFHDAARRGYDAVVAMYHDQALIPIKTLAFDRGVNVTLGLPFVRTSPDHGTAFDIATRGIANPESLIQALGVAHSMAAARASRAKAKT